MVAPSSPAPVDSISSPVVSSAACSASTAAWATSPTACEKAFELDHHDGVHEVSTAEACASHVAVRM